MSTPTLASVPDLLLDELARAERGVVVLAVDGLSYPAAVDAGWQPTVLLSTFPSTSAPAWLTALTGVGPDRHGAVGMAYLVPGLGTLVNAITGDVLARCPAEPGGDRRIVVPAPTVFDRAGVDCRALAREIGHLSSPWARALLHGATVVPGPSPAELSTLATDPAGLVAGIAAAVEVELRSPGLIWGYVNLDDYIHQHGYDAAVVAAATRLRESAARWARDGWTVVAHSDHGQVPHRPDPSLVAGWSDVDSPDDCLLPAGGAGRVRWLYPRPGRVEAVRDRLAALLGSSASVSLVEEPGRIGAVVAVGQDERFPGYDPTLRWEHGATAPDEVRVPLAIWRP